MSLLPDKSARLRPAALALLSAALTASLLLSSSEVSLAETVSGPTPVATDSAPATTAPTDPGSATPAATTPAATTPAATTPAATTPAPTTPAPTTPAPTTPAPTTPTTTTGTVAPAVVTPETAVNATIQPVLRPRLDSPFISPKDFTPTVDDPAPGAIQPDLAYTPSTGGRVEVYTSIGNMENANDSDWRVVNEYAYLINSVPKGGYVYATVYNTYWDNATTKSPKRAANGTWSVPDTQVYAPTQAFMNQLNLYCDGTTCDTKAQKDHIKVLGSKKTIEDAIKQKSSLGLLLSAEKKDSNGVVTGGGAGLVQNCQTEEGACLATTTSGTPLMHSKYALFSASKDSTGKTWNDVIWITSANLNGQSGGNKSNFSVAIYGDHASYQNLLDKVWTPAYNLVNVPEKNKNHNYASFPAGYRDAAENGVPTTDGEFLFYPSPRQVDHEADLLKAADDTANKAGCKVYLVHSLFSTARKGVVDHLVGLQKDGCTVRLILGDSSMLSIADSYFSMGTGLREIINRVEFANVHDKSILVDYKVGAARSSVTFGGSANLNGTSLYFDELAFKSTNQYVADAAILQFERLYPIARSIAGIKKVSSVTVVPTGTMDAGAVFTVNAGNTFQLRAKVSSSDAKVAPTIPDVFWRSSNPDVASVDERTGKLTAKAEGTVTISATSYQGVKTGRTVLTVVPVGAVPQTPSTSIPTLSTSITARPYLTIQRYSGPKDKRKVVVTWGQGNVDLSGKVQLQYLTQSGKWVGSSKITVTNGRGSISRTFTGSQGSRMWRVKGYEVTSPVKKKVSLYSNYSSTVARTVSAKKTTLKIYGTPAVKKGQPAGFLLQWQNPYDTKYETRLWLQYRTGTKWHNYESSTDAKAHYYTIPKGSTTVTAAGWVLDSKGVTKSAYWRFKTSGVAQPKGKKVKYSNTIYVKVIK